jgi:hypothetical protein
MEENCPVIKYYKSIGRRLKRRPGKTQEREIKCW